MKKKHYVSNSFSQDFDSLQRKQALQPPSTFVLESEQPLDIKGSLVSIAYNYVKRKNVFKVTTSNASEYLFQVLLLCNKEKSRTR